MARFLSLVYSEIRGSVNGLTYSRNGNSAYVRSRATPVNPRTPAQTLVRTAMGQISSAWRSLTQGQQNAWNALAKTVPYTNSLGVVSYYSGLQLFMSCNLNRQTVGAAFLTDPVAPPTFNAMTLADLVADASSGSITATRDVTDGPALGFTYVCDATAPFSAGRSFVPKNLYKRIFIEGDPDSGAISFGGAYEGVWGSIAAKAGEKLSVRISLLHVASGFMSPRAEYATVIVA